MRLDLIQYSHTVTPIIYEYKPLLIFATPPGDIDCLVGLMDWINADWKEERAPRACVIAYEASTSRQSDHPLLYQLAEEKGIEWLPHIFFPFTATDMSTELNTAYLDYKVDYVYLRGVPSNVGIILRDAVRMGIKDEINWLLPTFSIEPVVVDIAGVEGVAGCHAGMVYGGLPSDDVPGVRAAKEMHDKYHPGIPFSNAYLYGYEQAIVAHTAVRMTLERVGLENLGGREMAKSTFEIKDLDFGGISPPLTMEPGNVTLDHHMKMVEWLDNGELVAIGDWFELPWVVGNPELWGPYMK